jgi:hypothetical protein
MITNHSKTAQGAIRPGTALIGIKIFGNLLFVAYIISIAQMDAIILDARLLCNQLRFGGICGPIAQQCNGNRICRRLLNFKNAIIILGIMVIRISPSMLYAGGAFTTLSLIDRKLLASGVVPLNPKSSLLSLIVNVFYLFRLQVSSQVVKGSNTGYAISLVQFHFYICR